MKVVNDTTLSHFRVSRCEFCGKARMCDPAHIFAEGHGSGRKLDLRCNLLALCRPCHSLSHAGHEPTHEQLLAIVATRERVLQSHIEQTIWFFRRLPRDPSDAEISRELAGLEVGTLELAKRCLREAGRI